jgi:phosphohistidine phosphatase
MKTLLLMRHAKSDWDADYDNDHERPLNNRGVQSARVMGRLLSARDLVPELVITSTAVRARSTATLASEAGDWSSEIVLEPTLYGTGADAAMQVASKSPNVERLMLVGHQPTWSILVAVLSGERVEMKTGTVAVLEFAIDEWRLVPSEQGRIAAVYQPRDHLGGEFDHQ